MKRFFTFIVLALLIQATAFSQTCLPEGIVFSTQLQIDDFKTNYPNCTTIEGYVEISGEEIDNLNGLSLITIIEGELEVGYTNALTSLSGLDNLTSIGETLRIYMNNGLSSLSGLDNLTSIGGNLRITNNSVINDLSALTNITTVPENLRIYMNETLTNLSGMENMTSIGDNLRITNNTALNSLSDLNNITSIGGELAVDNNDSLISLNGLENIEATSITDLTIRNNFSLSTCEVQSVCNYLATPNGDISIHNNALGCNSKDEVGEACNDLSISDINQKLEFSIYPNPAENEFSIISRNEVIIKEVTIFNQLGQKVLNSKRPQGPINVSILEQGIYVVELLTEKMKIRQKLIVR